MKEYYFMTDEYDRISNPIEPKDFKSKNQIKKIVKGLIGEWFDGDVGECYENGGLNVYELKINGPSICSVSLFKLLEVEKDYPFYCNEEGSNER